MGLPFNFQVRCYDSINALFLAQASQVVYGDDSAIKQFAKNNIGSASPFIVSKNCLRGFVVLVDQAAFVVFQGTNEIKDWLSNLDARFVSGTWGRVHRGFRNGLNEIWPAMKDALQAAGEEIKNVWFTGHSLGGALAMLAAADLAIDSPKVAGVYTFGQPRVGDGVFKRYYEQKLQYCTYRFANDRDIVPRVPPRGAGYYDIGRPFFFNSLGKLYKDARTWDVYLNRFASAAETAIVRHDQLISDGFYDHNMDEYIENLEKNQ